MYLYIYIELNSFSSYISEFHNIILKQACIEIVMNEQPYPPLALPINEKSIFVDLEKSIRLVCRLFFFLKIENQCT